MEARVHRVLIWTGPAMVLIWFVTFFGFGWFPPSAPSSTAEEIYALYADSPNLIKLCMIITMAASTLLVPWAVALSGRLRRIDGAKGLADVQMVSCSLLSLEFIIPIGVWMAAAFRYDGRSAEVTETLHDVGWILFVCVIWSVFVQLIAIGVAVLIDKRVRPVLPRWIGYLSIWTAVLIIPAGLVLYFKEGPFAWNGIVGIYIPLAAFAIWVLSLTITADRSLKEEIAAARTFGSGPSHDPASGVRSGSAAVR